MREIKFVFGAVKLCMYGISRYTFLRNSFLLDICARIFISDGYPISTVNFQRMFINDLISIYTNMNNSLSG